MKASIFRGGVPYDEALHRLNATFNPKPGDLITHEQLAEVIKEPKGSHRYQGVVNAWIRQKRKHGVALSGEGRARGIGLIAELPHESSDISRKKLGMAGKMLRRRAAVMDFADTTKLTESELKEFNMTRRAVHLGAAELASVQKTLKAPPAASGDNVRLLKQS